LLPTVGQTLPGGIRTHWVIKEISKITRPYPNLPVLAWRHEICGSSFLPLNNLRSYVLNCHYYLISGG
jgi:hypothetical protein